MTVKNPAITLNIDELTATLDSIGQPIRAFLEQQSLKPGVTIPEDTTEDIPIAGSAMIRATPILLVLGVLLFELMVSRS